MFNRPLHPLFTRGPLKLGAPHPFVTVPHDYATEFSAREYVAAATLGQPVGVGSLAFLLSAETPDPRLGPAELQFEQYMIDLAIIPGRGVWALVPVFDEWRVSLVILEEALGALAHLLDRPVRELPLGRAFVPVIFESAGPAPSSVDPRDVYDRSIYRDVVGTLRPANHDTTAVDTLIEQLLSAGDWLDGKDLAIDTAFGCIPEWLGLELEAAGIEGLHHRDPSWRQRLSAKYCAI